MAKNPFPSPRELNLREQMAYVLSDLGWAYNVACQFDKADERIEEGALLWRELGNMPMLSNNLNSSMFRLFWTGRRVHTNLVDISQRGLFLQGKSHFVQGDFKQAKVGA